MEVSGYCVSCSLLSSLSYSCFSMMDLFTLQQCSHLALQALYWLHTFLVVFLTDTLPMIFHWIPPCQFIFGRLVQCPILLFPCPVIYHFGCWWLGSFRHTSFFSLACLTQSNLWKNLSWVRGNSAWHVLSVLCFEWQASNT